MFEEEEAVVVEVVGAGYRGGGGGRVGLSLRALLADRRCWNVRSKLFAMLTNEEQIISKDTTSLYALGDNDDTDAVTMNRALTLSG